MAPLPPPITRAPAVAGKFYPGEAGAVAEAVTRLMDAAPRRSVGDVVALISPHAGWMYSGTVAAAAYRALPEGLYDTVVIVGAGHRKGVAGAAFHPGDYATPEGALSFDAALAERMMGETPLIVPDASAHRGEHSVEVQVPFVRRALGPVKSVCLAMNTEELKDALAVGHALAAALAGRKALLVASTDLSHFPDGPSADLVDATTMAALATMDPDLFWLSNRLLLERGVPELVTACCGAAAVAAVLQAAKDLGANGMALLERAHSGTVMGDENSREVVGYAAAAFVRSAEKLVPTEHSDREQAALLAAARESVAGTVEDRPAGAVPLSPLARLNLPGAAFVTLTGPGGSLRGCIGELEPRRSLLESVTANAAAAATQDNRFAPVTPEELPGLGVEISVLSPQRPCHWKEVKPGDGVVLQRGQRRGVFLPQVWEKLPEVRRFLEVLCSEKAGLPPDAYKQPGASLRVFSVEKMAEKGKK